VVQRNDLGLIAVLSPQFALPAKGDPYLVDTAMTNGGRNARRRKRAVRHSPGWVVREKSNLRAVRCEVVGDGGKIA
jgi:hypothetical protein